MEPGKEPQGATRRTYVLVWIGLLLLTGLTVSVAGMNLGRLSALVALVIAGVKSSLVLMYFMHLKFDQPVYTIMVSIVLFVFVAVIVITFLDYSFR